MEIVARIAAPVGVTVSTTSVVSSPDAPPEPWLFHFATRKTRVILGHNAFRGHVAHFQDVLPALLAANFANLVRLVLLDR